MTQLFGTDGIRGRAGDPPLDPATIQRIGRAIVRALGVSRPRVLIGRDTRESSAGIESHVAAGLAAEGADVVSTAVLPTPAVAHLARLLGFDLGVVISASHNPYEDNGIKVFGGGRKFTTELEERTEAIFDTLPEATTPPPVVRVEDLSGRYLEHLRRAAPVASLAGVRLVADCANGATSSLARALFEGLGADVQIRHDAPDGRNINHRCGATVPEEMAAEVVRAQAHLGVAFDGDGDRAIFADAEGRIVHGDHVLFLAARHLHAQGRLTGGCVVATVMSNLGLEHALGKLGLGLVRASVGDRHVLDEMVRHGANLGGEQSGHIIFLDHEPAGDGLLTALQILGVVLASGRSLNDLARDLPIYPQVHRNVRVRAKADLEHIAGVRAALDEARRVLDGRGRMLVRYSGTEPVLRVMVEGPDAEEALRVAEAIASAATAAIGTPPAPVQACLERAAPVSFMESSRDVAQRAPVGDRSLAMIEAVGLSDVGRRRKLNEDSILVDSETGLFSVCDGMGGHNAGEVASQMAIEALGSFIQKSHVEKEITWPFGLDVNLSYDGNRLKTAIKLANKRVYKAADNKEEYTGMGTTVVAALVSGNLLSVGWAGDSRCYFIRNGVLTQLTRDDSWVSAAWAEGILSASEIEKHPLRNVITKAVGAKDTIETDIVEHRFQPGDVALICSDGLHSMMNDEQIIATVTPFPPTLQDAAAKLIEAANEAGGKDNVSVVLLRYTE